MTAMDRDTYLREVVAAYQGEVRGEATFATSAELSTDADEIETWRTLARLEATTRRRLLPLMERYGLDTTPDEAERRVGRERAEARAAAGFAATLASMPRGCRRSSPSMPGSRRKALPKIGRNWHSSTPTRSPSMSS